MPKCIVTGCKSEADDVVTANLRFFSIPTRDAVISKRWLDATSSQIMDIKTARICHKHFRDEDFCLRDTLTEVAITKRRLKKGAVPTQHLPKKRQQCRRHRRVKHAAEKESSDDDRKCLVGQALAEYTGKSTDPSKVDYYDYVVHTSLKVKAVNLPIEVANGDQKDVQPSVQYAEEQKSIKLAMAIRTAEYKNRKLEKEYQRRLKRLAPLNLGLNKLKYIFNDRQIFKLRTGAKSVIWHEEDMLGATMLLHSIGTSVYSDLTANGHPLPRKSTVKKWARSRREIPFTSSIDECSESSGNESDSELPNCDFLHPADIKRIGPNYYLEITDYMKIRIFELERDTIPLTLTERPKKPKLKTPRIRKDKTIIEFFSCSLCNKQFNSKHRLIRHQMVHTGERPHICSFQECKRAFAMKCNLKAHMKIHEKTCGGTDVPDENRVLRISKGSSGLIVEGDDGGELEFASNLFDQVME